MSLYGGCCLHERIAEKPRVILSEHVHQVWAVIDRYLDDVLVKCG